MQHRQIVCTLCQCVVYADVNDYLASLDPYPSIFAAENIARHTGLLDLQCKVPTGGMPGIVPRNDVFAPYSRLVECVHLLGVMNSFFIDYEALEGRPRFDVQSGLNIRIVEKFVTHFKQLLGQAQEEANAVEALMGLIHYMETLSKSGSIVHHFLQVYAPYVKFEAHDLPNRPWTSQRMHDIFDRVHQDAQAIRDAYSRYSLQFELVYVLVYAYLYSSDMEVLVNLVLRLLSKICRHEFVLPHREALQKYFEGQLRHRKDARLQRRRRLLMQEGCRDYLSLDFLRELQDLYAVFESRFETFWRTRLRDGGSPDLLSYALSQAFPAILFPNDDHYYAYCVGVPYLKDNLCKESLTFKKGAVAIARNVMDNIMTFMRRFREFESKDGIRIEYWTSESFQLFLGSDEDFQTRFKDLFEMILASSKA